jgi:nitronate monooxygenase
VPNAKARIVAASGDATLRTRVFDLARAIDWPVQYTGRALANDFSSRWVGHEDELERSLESERARYAAAASAGDVSTAVVWAGEGVDLVQAVEPAADIVERVVAEARAVLDRIGSLRP